MLQLHLLGVDRMDAGETEGQGIDPVIEELIRELREALSPRRRKPEKRLAAPYVPAEQTPKQIAKAEKRRMLQERRNEKARRIAEQAALEQRINQQRTCAECGTELRPIEGDDFLPRLCSRCVSRNAALSANFRPKSVTPYASVKIVPGGAPGSGRRK